MFAIDLAGDDSEKENQEPISKPAANQASTSDRPTAAKQDEVVPDEIMASAQTLTGIKRAFPKPRKEEEEDDFLGAPDSDEFDFI
jgi:hypothetical protein